MCGIMAYIGNKPVKEILLKGLKSLEYRGYDSSGIAILNGHISVCKSVGGVDLLEEKICSQKLTGNTGMAHTRWATHGKVNEINAHPQVSECKRYAIVHNGIIENHSIIKQQLEHHGFKFKSETDTEVLLNYIVYHLNKGILIQDVFIRLMKNLEGSYAFVFMDEAAPGQLWCMRKGAPIAIGINDGESYISSDSYAFAGMAISYFLPENNQFVHLSIHNAPIIFDEKGRVPDPVLMPVLTNDSTGLNGYEHYMIKEIHEQSGILNKTMNLDRECLLKDFGKIVSERISGARIIILACGSSLYAGMTGRYMIEKYTGIPVIVEHASEFRYRKPVIWPGDLIIAISQSGETADTLAAIEYVKQKGATVLSMCNVAHSSMAVLSDNTVPLQAGQEVGVASTKAFFAQLVQFIRLTVFLSKDASLRDKLLSDLPKLKNQIERMLADKLKIKDITSYYKNSENFLYIGRGINYPLAMEGALKLKEISYIHAEGYPAAEMKHGPIALIEDGFPVIALANDKSNKQKILSNIQEIRSRKGHIIVFATEGDTILPEYAEHTVFIPDTNELFSVLLSIIPIQFFAYYMALNKGCNVDRPRNLAKSVTVE